MSPLAFATITVIVLALYIPSAAWVIDQFVGENELCSFSLEDVPAQCPKCLTKPSAPIIFALPTMQQKTKFWYQVYGGALNAARDIGIPLSIRGLDTDNLGCEAITLYPQMIRDAAAEPNSGIVVVPYQPPAECGDLGVLTAMKEVADQGASVIAINSNPTAALENGAIMYVGEDNFQTGNSACNLLSQNAGGNATILYIGIDDGTNPGILGRVEGCRASEAKEVIFMFTNNGLANDTAAIVTALKNNTKINAMIANGGPNHVSAMLQAAEQMGRTPGPGPNQDIYVAIFGWAPLYATDALSAGKLEFVIDQQAPLQGSIPVHMLYMKAATGNFPLSDKIYTGPVVVRANATYEAAPDGGGCSPYPLPYCGECNGTASDQGLSNSSSNTILSFLSTSIMLLISFVVFPYLAVI